MIKVDLGNRTLGVTFQRELEHHETSSTKKGRVTFFHRSLRATYCELHSIGEDGKSSGILARTRVRCSSLDHFKREQGRKLALRRALLTLGIPREERIKVWKTYHSRPRTPGEPKAQGEGVREGVKEGEIIETTGEEKAAQRHAQHDLHAGEV